VTAYRIVADPVPLVGPSVESSKTVSLIRHWQSPGSVVSVNDPLPPAGENDSDVGLTE
jgi:hypothetical protein